MPALTQHSTSITLFRISAAMFLNYLTIGIPLVMLPLYVQQQLHLSDLLIGIAVGSQFIATLLTRGAAGRKADTSGGRRTVITGQFYCAASGLLMLVSLIAHPVPLLAWAILIVGRVLLGIGESFILTGNLTWGCGWRARPTRVRLFPGTAWRPTVRWLSARRWGCRFTPGPAWRFRRSSSCCCRSSPAESSMAFREYPNSPSPRASATGSRPGVAARNRACAPGHWFCHPKRVYRPLVQRASLG